jgi:hypothetical protein
MAWPSYGRLVLNSLGEKPQAAVRRSAMESGPVKQAQFMSRQLVARELTYRYTGDEYDQWKTWYRTQISRGAAWFDWVDPHDGATKQARIASGEYEATAESAGPGSPPAWLLSCTIETWE